MDGSDLARQLDRSDVLARFREEFHLPAGGIYLDGNSLGPLCHRAKATLDAAVTEIGMLEIYMQEVNSDRRWHVEFNVRAHDQV